MENISAQMYFMGNGVSGFSHCPPQQDFEEEEDTKPQKAVKREKRKYRCRKRSPATIERAKTVRRDKANARERRRMNSLNDALEHLRTILPALPDEPKMTKIETLRKAQEYIASLTYQLSSPDSPNTSISPVFSGSAHSCESGSCGCSVQSTPFQSPCFPQPQLQYHHHYSNPHISPYFPTN